MLHRIMCCSIHLEGRPLFSCDGYYIVIPRYNLKIEVSNGNDVTYFLLGDDDVHKLLKISCKDLLPSIEDPNSDIYPLVFTQLLEKELLFLVEKKNNGSSVNERCFKKRCTVGHLLGNEGDALHVNNLQESSHASALPTDNFLSAWSDMGQPSSSSSASVNDLSAGWNSQLDTGEAIDKHCLDNAPTTK
ncbi:Nucleic acid-binding, OB-fold [Sesbania bispinosa]|nr:Nucleic acid-binding, OB-fold [Sesbania bispinosa]